MLVMDMTVSVTAIVIVIVTAVMRHAGMGMGAVMTMIPVVAMAMIGCCAATAIAGTSCGGRSARRSPRPLVQTSLAPNAAIRA